MRVLGIETTCDETAAAVVRLRPDGSGEIMADEVMSQIAAHAAFGGVVPEIAARAHVEIVDTLIARALAQAGMAAGDLDGVAAAAGPGLIGGVLVGLMAGKGIALAIGKPLVAVNHLEAHALTARLTAHVAFPYLILLASGGHTQILAVRGVGDYDRLGATMDDAIGEAFDKTAKLLGLPYPGGPAVESAAREGDRERFALPRPMIGRPNADFSLSGLKTAVRLAAATRRSPARPRRGRSLRFLSGCDRRRGRGSDADGAEAISTAPRPSPRGGRRFRRRGGQCGAPRRARAVMRRGRPADGRPAAEPLHRQRGDDRLGRDRTAEAWASLTRSTSPLALAGRSIRNRSARSTTRRNETGSVPLGAGAGCSLCAAADFAFSFSFVHWRDGGRRGSRQSRQGWRGGRHNGRRRRRRARP